MSSLTARISADAGVRVTRHHIISREVRERDTGSSAGFPIRCCRSHKRYGFRAELCANSGRIAYIAAIVWCDRTDDYGVLNDNRTVLGDV